MKLWKEQKGKKQIQESSKNWENPNNILHKESENRSKNEVLEIKNHTDRDESFFGMTKRRQKIELSLMFDTKGKPRTEQMATMEVLGSITNLPQKHN